jgi:hypothetical protein
MLSFTGSLRFESAGAAVVFPGFSSEDPEQEHAITALASTAIQSGTLVTGMAD